MAKQLLLFILVSLLFVGCTQPDNGGAGSAALDSTMTPMAERYVKLVLAVGEHSADYVDAYYGPAAWRDEVKLTKLTLDQIQDQASALAAELRSVDVSMAEELVQLRKTYLVGQIEALQAYVRTLQGERMKFDDESQALYDATAPAYSESHFKEMIDRLDSVLPGSGPVPVRLAAYKKGFIIPKDKLDAVFRPAIAEARRRTMAQVQLPAEESFTLEYVTDKPWSGYNWYQGNLKSLIQINTDLPIFIDRAIDLGAHEGYPGHHVYNVLLEQALVKGRGWPEYQAYALFSPQSLIAEGSANYGIDMAFPGDERTAFEQDTLFPLAGIDPGKAEEYARIRDLADRLSYAGNEAARKYLNGEINADEAARWLTTYALMEPERARQRVRFFDTYRSYVINYNYGKDLVRSYVEAAGNTKDLRWQRFKSLLSSPRLPSGLRQ